MQIPLNHSTAVPLYRQIEDHLRQSIMSGNLAPGTRLPATRSLAHDLGVNRVTAEAAYAELEADGLISSRVGSGTFVTFPAPSAVRPAGGRSNPWPLWQRSLEATQQAAAWTSPDEMLRAAGHPRPISFAGGTGDPGLFPTDDFRKAIQSVARRDGSAIMGYGESVGYEPLRNTVTRILASQGLETRPQHVLITTGSQQALALATELLLKPGDTVMVESPTYGRILDLFHSLSLTIVGVPADALGIQTDVLEGLLQQHHPKMIYVMPDFQNPTGACLDNARRRHLIDLAGRYNVPILEDDYIGDLRFEGSGRPPLKALDPGGRVIYASTFSKMLMPGLRLGFLVAEGPVFDCLVWGKRVHDVATPNLLQRALEEYVTVGRYQAHLRRSCMVYRKRRDAMMAAIRRWLPASVRVDPPRGGLFAWLRLPDGLSSEDLLVKACREGVAFAPGTEFFVNSEDGLGFARLNFAAVADDTIEEGIMRLGRAMSQF